MALTQKKLNEQYKRKALKTKRLRKKIDVIGFVKQKGMK